MALIIDLLHGTAYSRVLERAMRTDFQGVMTVLGCLRELRFCSERGRASDPHLFKLL
jgi:hypothetical protein